MIDMAGVRLYEVAELEQELHLTKRTLLGYIRAGRLAARKVGRKWYVAEQDLNAFLRATAQRKEDKVDTKGGGWYRKPCGLKRGE